MDVVRMSLEKVFEDPSNARKHGEKNLAAIKASLQKFGQQKAIVVGRDNVCIAGSGTLLAARDLGWKHIFVVYSDLSGAEAVAYGIADNRTTDLGDWDLPVLGDHFRALGDAGIELLDLGFDSQDLGEFKFDVPGEKKTEGKTDGDHVPDDAPSVCSPGDEWILGRHRLYCGDGLYFTGPKADITFTSPPYNMLVSSAKFRSDGNLYNDFDDNQAPEVWLDFICNAVEMSLRQSRYQFWNIQFLAGNRTTLPMFWHKFRDRIVDVAIWNKGHGVPQQALRVMNTGFEFIFIFTSDKDPSRAIRCAPEFQGTVNNVFDIAGQRKNEFSHIHAATFPLELPETFIERFCPVGGSVLDPFLGTGTTLIACEKTGKTCYGVEIDPKYCDIVINRWENFTGEKAVKQGENQ